MAPPQNPYQVLGLRPTATSDEIRRAYRRLALECHPDRRPGDAAATARFRELTQAYNTLTDPARRREVDGLLRSFWRQVVGARAAGGAGGEGEKPGRRGGRAGAGGAARAAAPPEKGERGERDAAGADRRRGGGFFDALFGNVRGGGEGPAAPTPPASPASAPVAGERGGSVAAAGRGRPAPVLGASERGGADLRPEPTLDVRREVAGAPAARPEAAPAAAVAAPAAAAVVAGPSPLPPTAASAGAAPRAEAPPAATPPQPLERGETRVKTIEVPFELAAVGGMFEADLSLDFACPDCGGSGSAPGAECPDCPDCGGTGERLVLPSAARTSPGGAVVATEPAAPERSVCPRCLGRGHLVTQPCAKCEGGGSIQHQRRYRLAIPPCMNDLHRIRIEGEGEPGPGGGPAGDLLLVVSAKRHPHFRRRGRDIHATVVLNLAQAVFGDVIEAPTLHGPVSLEMPAGTQPGAMFRLAGWGVGGARSLLTAAGDRPPMQAMGGGGAESPAWEGGGKGGSAAAGSGSGDAPAPGDHYVQVQVTIPLLKKETDRKRFYTMAKSLKLLEGMTEPPADPKPAKGRSA